MTANASLLRQKACSCCGTRFDCAAGGCWCDDVPLTTGMRKALGANYTDCLCPTCLRAISDHSDPLMIQFLRWLAERPRTYADVMEAWRTSCPRQSIWEDAQADGLVADDSQNVTLTPRGQVVLEAATLRSSPLPPSRPS